jgi:immune inhibitor A
VPSTRQTAGWRLLAPFVVFALVASALLVAQANVAQPGGRVDDRVTTSARDYYYTLAAPRVQSDVSTDVRVPENLNTGVEAYGPLSDLQAWWQQQQRKHSNGFPRASEALAQLEAQAVATGQNPRQIKQAKQTQQARLLTVLVEFNPSADDDFSGFNRIIDINSVAGEDCVVEPEGTLLNGPLHNDLPNPSTNGAGNDNNTFWVEDFNAQHYEDLMFSSAGITERVRPDLTGPDGQPGIDISGFTMRNMYLEMSKGAYDLTGDIVGWVELPHSEGWYGADTCEAGRASDVGHPDNPRGAPQMVVDAVDAIAAADPSFPWTDYDIEDQGDLDGDGNFFEPDGVIDHFVIVHAGAGEEGGGGAQGVYAVWSHSSIVDPSAGGYTIPGTSTKVFNYIAQPEDAGVGVFAHEYGHDLGLPDLYDVVGGLGTSIEFWDLMNTGSHSGPVFQSMPAHMGLWDKFVLGWADPVIFNPGDNPRMVQVGQTSRTPRGTKDGIRVNLPLKEITLAGPHSGANMWWSNSDQDWADVRLTRSIDVPDAGDVRFWVWNDYILEDLWDYGFIEVSEDSGTSWVQLEVFDETDTLVSTDADPNGRLVDYGGLENGLTGDSGGFRHDYVSLTPYLGQTIQLRLRAATDAAFLERGWFADDFELTQDGSVLWSDDVEGGAGDWTATVESFAGTSGAGWVITDGSFQFAQYYLAEWRNLDGFDRGLSYTYDSDYLRFDTGEWSVKRVPYNAPGMLVWYRNIQYGNVNNSGANLFALPSVGAKGGLLMVDSHFDPLRRTGDASVHDTSVLKNIQSRPQAANAAFGVAPTYEFTECLEDPAGSYTLYCTVFGPQAPVSTFSDDVTWYPGIEIRPEIGPFALFFRDSDASVVIPSDGHQLYSVRFVNPDGSLATSHVLYGLDLGGNLVLGTGNPSDGYDVFNPTDLSMGMVFQISKVYAGNTYARIYVDPGN